MYKGETVQNQIIVLKFYQSLHLLKLAIFLAPYSSNVVYKFSCLRDAGCSYIGQTKRHLVTRVNEHVELKKLDQFDRQKSEIKNHMYDCSSCHEYKLGFNNFEILKRCQNSYNTKITEALCIKRLRPKLNKKLMTKGCSYLLKVF